MSRSARYSVVVLLIAATLLISVFVAPTQAVPVHAQQPTGSIPTVTGTPVGPFVTVDLSLDQVDIYAGPSQYLYPRVGVMLGGEQAPALGLSEDQSWVEIRYPGVPGSAGWIYALYVSLSRGSELSTVPAPSTPTPASTPTINPTLVAAFIAPQTATRIATFTAPAPLQIPTFVDETTRASRIPLGLLIFGFAFIGVLGAILSFLRGR